MRKLGISLYPKKETLEKDFEYLENAAKNGFTRLFTCMQSAKGEREELIDIYSKVIKKAHELGFEVSVDTVPSTFEAFGVTPRNIKPFADMGIDIIRFDSSFGLYDDIAIINNPYGIKVELNGSLLTGVETLIENGANRSRILICHNFYPQRYTGLDFSIFENLNKRWNGLYLNTAAFVSSNNVNTVGPWPVSAGLPTCEIHRDLPIDIQVRHMIATNQINDILIGNAYATDEELEMIGKIDLTKTTIGIVVEENISELEQKIIFDLPQGRRMDCSSLIIRSAGTRFACKNSSIPAREYNEEYFHHGDVVIVNDNLSPYRGELQVILKDIKNDGDRNLVGHIKKEEMLILDSIKLGQRFSFIK